MIKNPGCDIIPAMLELSVQAKSPAAINTAIKKIKEMITSGSVARTSPIHLTLGPGIYRELVRYNLPNPLFLESVPGTKASDCVIQADNCESFHHGAENRAVFVLGPNTTNVKIKNISIVNLHNKSPDVEAVFNPADSAEALVWSSTNGTLFADGVRIEGRQNTLCLKGVSWFKDSFISGDVDFIYGDVSTAFFEECEINLREDNRGDFPGYAVKSQALAEKSGFVFMNCRFTGEKRKKNRIFLCRTDGKGSADSLKGWDSIAVVNCFFSENFDDELAWDDDMEKEIYPRGNKMTGIREYNSKVVLKNGKVTEADTTRRNIKTYLMTEDDYFTHYASRFLILHDTPFGEVEA